MAKTSPGACAFKGRGGASPRGRALGTGRCKGRGRAGRALDQPRDQFQTLLRAGTGKAARLRRGRVSEVAGEGPARGKRRLPAV